jgi:hypothetical protein
MLIIIVLQVSVVMVSVVLWDIAVTADAYRAFQEQYLVLTAYVTKRVALHRRIVLPDNAVTADAYHAHLDKSLAKTVCVILPAVVPGTAR